MKTIKLILKLAGQKYWWFMKNIGIYLIVGGVLGRVIYTNTADYRIKTFENTFMEMLMGKKTPEESSEAAHKMISGAKNQRECFTAVDAMAEIFQKNKYNPADVIQVSDKQFYKDCI